MDAPERAASGRVARSGAVRSSCRRKEAEASVPEPCADQSERDHAALLAAIESGRIAAEEL